MNEPKLEVQCPTEKRYEGDLVGCGSKRVRYDADEKAYDCLDCGLWWFTPQSVRVGVRADK